ncbi:MAG: hypothetical protein COA79_13550 [Planctomycetota bacterium]|nr:MAG: hypothetical protein COA79_13550 [Planctomycetota bacterium]
MFKIYLLALFLISFDVHNIFGQQIQILTNNKKKELISGATIERSSEANAYLERAKTFIKAEKYQDAVLLLKTTVEKYGNTLTSSNEELYLPLSEHIHKMILELPQEGRDLYFVEVDSIAGSLFYEAKRTNSSQLFKKVISKYYLSNHGDDACYYYGLYLLDKGDIYSAKDYLELALNHPLRSFSASRIKLCLSYIYGVLNKKQKHKSFANEVRKIDFLLSQLNKVENVLRVKNTNSLFDLFAENSNGTNIETLQINFEFGNQQLWAPVYSHFNDFNHKPGRTTYRSSRNSVPISSKSRAKNRKKFVKLWKKNRWYPTRNLVVHGNSVLFRENDKLSKFKLDTQELEWEIDFSPTGSSNSSGSYSSYSHYGNQHRKMPNSASEIKLFSNQTGSLMKVVGNSAYILVGHSKTGKMISMSAMRFSRRNSKKQDVGNKIYQIDLKTGKRKWAIGQFDSAEKEFYNVIFLNLPIQTPYGLFLTYIKKNELYGVMVDKKKKIIWKKYLCSYKNGPALLLDTTSIAYGEEALFIGVDFGVLVKIKANDGRYCWIKRYGTISSGTKRNYYYMPTVKPGAEDNQIIYNNGRVIIIPSDSKKIYFYDSRSGKEVAVISDDFLDFRRYLIGHDSFGIIMGGEKGIKKYDINSGELLWKSQIAESYGRGQLSKNRIYFSSKDSVYQIDAINGKKITKISIPLDDINDCIGNLHLSNDNLIISHLNGFFSVSNISILIERLTKKLEKEPNADNYFKRGLLYQKFNQEKLAFKDFENALSLTDKKSEIYKKSSASLFNIFKEVTSKSGNASDLLPIIEQLLDDPKYKLVIQYWKGVVSYNKKEYTKSLDLFLIVFKHKAKNNEMLISINNKNVKPWVISLSKISSLIKVNKKFESKFIESITTNNDSNAIGTDKILLALSVLKSKNFSEWAMKKLHLNKSFKSAQNQSIFNRLINHQNKLISNSALYWMFKSKIAIESYWEAKKIYEQLKLKNSNTQIFTSSKYEVLSDLLKKYKNKFDSLENKYKPGTNSITDPPLEPIWSSKDISPGNKSYVGLGIEKRTEYLENHIMLFDKDEHQVYCADLYKGKIKWRFNVDKKLNEMYFTHYKKAHNLRQNNLAIYKDPVFFWGIDLISGKRLWKVKHNEAGLKGISSSVFVSVLFDKAIVRSLINGKILWIINVDPDISKNIFVSEKTIAFMSDNHSKLLIVDQLFGNEIKTVEIDNMHNSNSIHLMGNYLYYQNNNSKSVCLDLTSGKELWKKSFGFYYYGRNGSFYDLKKGRFLILGSSKKLYCIDKLTGKKIWSKKIANNNDRNFSIYPVKGSDILLTRIISGSRNKESTVTLKELDLNTGEEVSSIQRKIPQNKIWQLQRKGLHRMAVNGEVFPIEKEDKNGNKKITFIRKRDGNIVKKYFIDLKRHSSFSGFFFKGIMFFANKNSNSNIFIEAYSNKKFISNKLSFMKQMKILFRESGKDASKN